MGSVQFHFVLVMSYFVRFFFSLVWADNRDMKLVFSFFFLHYFCIFFVGQFSVYLSVVFCVALFSGSSVDAARFVVSFWSVSFENSQSKKKMIVVVVLVDESNGHACRRLLDRFQSGGLLYDFLLLLLLFLVCFLVVCYGGLRSVDPFVVQ